MLTSAQMVTLMVRISPLNLSTPGFIYSCFCGDIAGCFSPDAGSSQVFQDNLWCFCQWFPCVNLNTAKIQTKQQKLVKKCCVFILSVVLHIYSAVRFEHTCAIFPDFSLRWILQDLSSRCSSLPLWQRETFYPRLLNETLPSSAADRHNIASQHQVARRTAVVDRSTTVGPVHMCRGGGRADEASRWRRLFQSRLSARDPTSCWVSFIKPSLSCVWTSDSSGGEKCGIHLALRSTRLRGPQEVCGSWYEGPEKAEQ